MTSVPNHPPRLNGSKWLFFILICCFVSACGLFKPAESGDTDRGKKPPGKTTEVEELDPIEGRVIYNKRTGQYEEVSILTSRMDTVVWRDTPINEAPPITSEGRYVDTGSGQQTGTGDFGSELFSSYNVSLMLPFLTDRFAFGSNSLPENSDWAVHYYAGTKMALDALSSEGVKLNVNVLDSKASQGETQQLVNSNTDVASAHLLIGPYRRDNVKIVGEYAARRNKTFISPYNANPDVLRSNNNYLQVNPSFDTHLEKIIDHALASHTPYQIVLVVRDKPAEVNRVKELQAILAKRFENSVGQKPVFREYVVPEESADYNNINPQPYLLSGTPTAFIVPSWSNENFVYTFLRKLYLLRRPYPVTVYGMPQWAEFQNLEFDYLESLNVHISSSSFIDPYSPEIQRFKRQFFDRYGTIPRDEAYLGYDVMLFAGRMLSKYGTKFQFYLDQEEGDMLHTKFKFEQVLIPNPRPEQMMKNIDRFENKYVNILKFKEYYFQLAN